jgi:hypothetical protein
MRPRAARAVMKALPGFPNAIAYSWTNGWGASREKRVSRSGVQNKRRMIVAKLRMPVANALVIIPFPATTLCRKL